jgi:hypothetical protein
MPSFGDTDIPEGIKAPSEYPDINLLIIGGPPKTKTLQLTEITQIR